MIKRSIDVGLLISAVAGVLTTQVVLWFHLIFVLLIVAALMLPFRPFAVRLVAWSLISTGLVVWAVMDLETPSQELTELPILTFALVLVFLVAQSRGRTLEALRHAQREGEMRTALERESMQAQLEQSQRLDVLGRASTRTAHDMRNVLTIVRGCAAELADDVDPSARNTRTEIMDAVDRGIDMLDELLAAGRANSGASTPIDLRRTLAQAKLLLAHLLHDGIVMRCTTPSEPVAVHLDRTSFMQIMMNLVANAVDAVGDHGTIAIGVREVHRHRVNTVGLERCAVISVADSGPGLLADHGDVFDPGYTTKGDRHSGLGLSTVWQIAARAGGSVEIDSSPGVGTTVSVLLPLTGVSHRRKRCVLCVDDERTHSMLSEEFSAIGFEVHPAATASEDARVGADVAVIDDRHPGGASIGDDALHVIRLDHAGLWRPPLTSDEASRLVGRIVRAIDNTS